MSTDRSCPICTRDRLCRCILDGVGLLTSEGEDVEFSVGQTYSIAIDFSFNLFVYFLVRILVGESKLQDWGFSLVNTF
ncbi:hypothetical protein M6B38_116345 [Iris pallida]|uniref:Uncharacterized protein n=1 Tax=Iris pallida TaxID=29817 RepID=A0AAX6I4I0_IRIPA|nr:hypothetical protein M6B38_116340 [Iris pallida]KAJ6848093.1 hypothetical protein M6B38_116345 [Iris pallida]